MTEPILIRYHGASGLFELIGEVSGPCRLMRLQGDKGELPGASGKFIELLQFDDVAAFWAWLSRDTDWYEMKAQQLHPLMAGLIGQFLPHFKRQNELSQMQHISLMHWENAIRQADPGFEPLQFCGICHADVAYFPRYPKYLCKACEARISDAKGRLVEYSNTAAMGYGCQGYYRDTDPPERYDSDVCYVDGVACKAQEARFGGIVIQKTDNP